MKNKNFKKGFTLVEMLIVVVIIGILAAALIPRLLGAQSQARDVTRKTGLNQLMAGLGMYYNDQGMYPYGDCTYHLDGSYVNIPTAWSYGDANRDKEKDLTDSNGTFHKPDNNLVRLGYMSDVPKDNQKQKITYGTWQGGCTNGYWGYRNFSTGSRRSYSYFINVNMENYKNMNYVFPSSVIGTLTDADLGRVGGIENFKSKLCSKVDKGAGTCQTDDIRLGSYVVFGEQQ